MNTVASNWELWTKMVMPAGAGQVQRKETRRAFYGGAVAMLTMLRDLGNAEMSPEAGAAVLDGLEDELKRFSEEVAAGRA